MAGATDPGALLPLKHLHDSCFQPWSSGYAYAFAPVQLWPCSQKSTISKWRFEAPFLSGAYSNTKFCPTLLPKSKIQNYFEIPPSRGISKRQTNFDQMIHTSLDCDLPFSGWSEVIHSESIRIPFVFVFPDCFLCCLYY